MEEVRTTKAMSWRARWLEENAPFRKVEVRQSADPQLVLIRGVCLAVTARWAKEMVKDDRRLDRHVVRDLTAAANQHRGKLGIARQESIFGPRLRQMQAAYKLTGDPAEVFSREGVAVETRMVKSVKQAVIEFAKTMGDEGKAIFLISFKTKTGSHVIGLHGNRKHRQVGFFDSNVGIYRYDDLTTFANALADLLLDYYSTPSDVILRKVKT